jgi:hypothetical protein
VRAAVSCAAHPHVVVLGYSPPLCPPHPISSRLSSGLLLIRFSYVVRPYPSLFVFHDADFFKYDVELHSKLAEVGREKGRV